MVMLKAAEAEGGVIGGAGGRGLRLSDLLLGKAATLILALGALGLGIATFSVLANGLPLGLRPNLVLALVLANALVLLLLIVVLAARVVRVILERRRGSAGAKLHVRLVLLFSGVAVVPAIVVAGFAAAIFNVGIEAWFNDRVRTALEESLEAARGYLEEHRNNIRVDALAMANDLTQAGRFLADDPDTFARILVTQAALRGLTEAVVFEPETGQVLASAGLMAGLGVDLPPPWAIAEARAGDAVVMDGGDNTRVQAVVALATTPALMLLIDRPVDPAILDHMARVQKAVAEYDRLDQTRSGLEITFAVVFAIVALLVLAAAILVGLVLANQIARPVGRLILAAERVRMGDLDVIVPEIASGDEIADLSRAFNRMTGQLAAQREELMAAYGQLDERRRFTEAVLAGVSAGVIGIDAEGRIELPNRAASELLGRDLEAAIGRPLIEEVPEFAPLFAQSRAQPERSATAEIVIGPPARRRTLLVRIAAERRLEETGGFVVTFDDITELQSAQRKAAWADVARRIAHEIKNPLTPIQLAAERLKRRFAREIQSDPETFTQCAETIVRHVGDIGRMVDEFSAFARMPEPVIRPEDLGRIVREGVMLLRHERPDLQWEVALPEHGPVVPCDRRLISQALTNLIKNAIDAVAMRPGAGRISVGIEEGGETVTLTVRDDGIGLPAEDRHRLTEPYVTHKPKGTGLGLAIVKKVAEDHGGALVLEDGGGGMGAVARLVLPRRSDRS